jgi:uncharacterized phage-associated protein
MMNEIQFKFNREKAIEAILYIASRLDDPSFHSIGKILYFADKTSLEMYGRFVLGDTYAAFKHGPLPSATYDLMKAAKQSNDLPFKVHNHYEVVPLREPNLNVFSDSDIDCLDRMIQHYGSYTFWEKSELSHDAAWAKAWEHRGNKESNEIAIEDIVALLQDADMLLDYLKNRHEDG